MDFKRAIIVTFVPVADADKVREVIGKAGGGQIGEYSFCSYTVTGKGRFKPSDKAKPHIGATNQLETVDEERIEFVCDREQIKAIIAAIKQAHPYEEAAFNICPLIAEEDL